MRALARCVSVRVAAALLVVAAVVATGTATGASSTIVVAADVPSATTLVTTGCAPNVAGITNFGVVQPGSTALTQNDCTVSFGSSNDSSSLRVTQSDGTGSAMGHPTDAWTRHTGGSSRYAAVDSFGSMTWLVGSTGVGVRRSQDGGATWGGSIALTGSGNVGAISVPNGTSAWAAGDGSGNVWRSTNTNVATPTWGATTAAAGFAVRSVVAVATNTAWVVGDGGNIKVTTDGGSTWTPQTWTDAAGGPTAGTNQLGGVQALDSDSLVAWGPGGRILATSDAGANWRDISMASNTTVRDVAVISDTTMIAVGTDGIIFTTTNATAGTPTWTLRSTGTMRNLYDAEYLTATDVVVLGDDGIQLTSSDAGATWTLDNIDTAVMMAMMTSPAAGTLVAVGAGLNAVRTTDSAATWNYVITGSKSWQDVSMTTDRTGWRVGSDGTVEKTTTGGTSWVAQTSNTGADLFAVYAYDPLRAVAVGRGGAVVTTSDGGTTWTARSSGVTSDLEEVDGLDDGKAWAVGGNGAIIYSSTRGQSWVTQQTAAGVVLLDVFARDASTVVTTGRSGASYRTTNGGSTWSSVALPTGSSTVGSMSGDRLTGTAFYSTGNVYRSTDGGLTWTYMGNPVTAGSVEAISDTRLVLVRQGGSALYSTDAGATWTNASSGNLSAHWVAAADSMDRTTVVAVGDGNLSATTGSTSDIDNYVMNTSDWVGDGTEAFGMCLRSTTATATWTPNATCDQSADGAHWKAVPAVTDLTAEVAKTASGDGVRAANFRFGLRIAPNEPPGELSAGITFVVVAPAS